MKIAVYSRGLTSDQAVDLYKLLNIFHQRKVDIVLYRSLAEQFPHLLNDANISRFDASEDLAVGIDSLVSVGGDGTILDAVTLVRDKGIPILGINFGRLGFLAGVAREDIAMAAQALLDRHYVVDKRSLLHIEANLPLFGDTPFGLNDFAILKKDTSPMIKIHTYLNGELLNTYWSDGLIVATPTGSTAYNLSCNGPILFPNAACMAITPIAPHQLNVRPIVIPDNNVLTFEVESRNEQFICSLDARREVVDKNIQISIRKESFMVNIIRMNGTSFLSTMRNKLGWGLDKRN